jgi:hypothetical protein
MIERRIHPPCSILLLIALLANAAFTIAVPNAKIRTHADRRPPIASEP